MGAFRIITYIYTILSPSYWSDVIERARANAKERAAQAKTIDSTQTNDESEDAEEELVELYAEFEEGSELDVPKILDKMDVINYNEPEEVGPDDLEDTNYSNFYQPNLKEISTISEIYNGSFETIDGFECNSLMKYASHVILVSLVVLTLLYGLRRISLLNLLRKELQQPDFSSNEVKDPFCESFKMISGNSHDLSDDESLLEENYLSNGYIKKEPLGLHKSMLVSESRSEDALSDVATDEHRELGPFTLDSDDQVELVTITSDGNYSLFLKKETPGNLSHTDSPQSKVHIILKVNKRKSASDFQIFSNLSTTENKDFTIKKTNHHPLRKVINSDGNISIFNNSVNQSKDSIFETGSDDDKENHFKSRDSEICELLCESSCDSNESSNNTATTRKSSDTFQTPIKQTNKIVRIVEPGVEHRFPLFENRSYQRTEDILPRKGSILRVVFNESKPKETMAVTNIPGSPIKVLSQTKKQFSPRPISRQQILHISEEVNQFFFTNTKDPCEVREAVGEKFLSKIFGEDLEVSFDEFELQNFITGDIDKIMLLFKGGESCENRNQRFENFDILIGHLRTRFPEELHEYFMDLIYEKLESILEMTNTSRTDLLLKTIIFVRDLIYFGRGQILPDEVYVTLLHVLLPLTRASQTEKVAYDLAFKSLCLMIRAIEIESFINNFERTFSNILKNKILKGEKFTALFMIKFYILSNMDRRVNESGRFFAELIASKLVPIVPLLSIDAFQKTRSEILEIYCILHKIIPFSDILVEFYWKFSQFNRARVPVPEILKSIKLSSHDYISSPVSITKSLDSWESQLH